ncbi:DUF262 domain-containing protein [Rufibacter immobilis]|uniref:DUF262 domain-containing protein n=1 Tax=Rufibacter immobilis TaxID=1348778 RepID=A0A3M9N353_9BACT|nr:DUF262 domain-containing protein [Rufibacter immobilis]RNI32240.1 DUF262 domain-containing protein [Rufibacter immobilis]
MESTISQLFGTGSRKFEIPSYQRAYSWEDKQINQFLEDLKNAENQYYLGHFLFESNDDSTLYVIDGQQRLTTCVIFFSVLRRVLEERKKSSEEIRVDLDALASRYLVDKIEDTQKFKTVRSDNNFFVEEIIEGREGHSQEVDTTSKERIRNAKKVFSKQFATLSTELLERWCQIIEDATVTEFIVKDKVQAAQVFAFQNDRGKKLSKLEIIKAYFMLQIYLSSGSKEKISDNITYLEDEFSKIYKQIVRINLDEDEVLNHYWRAVSGQGFYSAEVIEGIKNKIKTKSGQQGELNSRTKWIKGFVSGLAQAFQTVEKVEKSNDVHTRHLRDLNNMALSYPFLIKAYKYGVSESSIDRLVRLLENITFRSLIRGGRAEIESRLNHYLVPFKSAEDIDTTISSTINSIRQSNWWWYWNDNSLKNQLYSGDFYQNRVDNYLLWRYELQLADKNHPVPHNVSFKDLIRNESIEHIAPQTPTNGDPVANGYGPYKVEAEPKDGISSGSWLNSIGNLMLIAQSQNSSLGNKAFSKKLEVYGKDNLLNQQKEIIEFVADKSNPVWDKTAIERRRDKIVKAALEIWSLDRLN